VALGLAGGLHLWRSAIIRWIVWAVIFVALLKLLYRPSRRLSDELADKAFHLRQWDRDPIVLVLDDGREVGAFLQSGIYIRPVGRGVDARRVIEIKAHPPAIQGPPASN
jgi:hypothetical protein